MTLRRLSFISVLLLVVGCGSAATDLAADEVGEAPTSLEAIDAKAAPADHPVTSIDEVAGRFWRPVLHEGVVVDPDDGDFWEFFVDGGGIGIRGDDGCNGFETTRLAGERPPRLDHGVLVDIEISIDAMDCPGNDNGPYPRDGDLLRLVDDAERLLVESDGAVRVELLPVDSGQSPESPADPASFTTLDSFTDIVRAYWVPVEEDGEPVPASLGAYWRLGGSSGDITLSGYDGCNRFQSEQYEGRSTTMVDGELTAVVTYSTMQDCGDDQTSSPQEGDTFEINVDGSTIRVNNGGSVRVVLDRRSEEPLGDRLRPEEERALEEELEAEAQAEAQLFDEQTQASIDQLRIDLDTARSRWDAAGIEDYIVDFAAGCLQCASWPTDPTVVGNRHSIVVQNGSGTGPWADSTIGASVDDWFDRLTAHLDAGGFALAEFDSDLGFPTSLYIAIGGPVGTDDPVGVDEGQLTDVVLTPSALPDDDIALIARLVASSWVPVAPEDAGIDIGQQRRRWTFSTKGRSLIIEGFDGCNSFSSFMSPDDAPGRLVDGVLIDFDVAIQEKGCDGVVPLTTPTNGDVLRVVDDGARLEVVRSGMVVVEFLAST